MLQSRRGFLIGAGSLLTTAFVSDKGTFICLDVSAWAGIAPASRSNHSFV